MPTPPRDQLARLLAGNDHVHAHSASTTLPYDALALYVEDVGDLTCPIRAAQAKKLIAVARPAAYGHGEETLHDTSVRDTWELTPDQVRLGGDEWHRRLDRVLEDFRDQLGLPPESQLRPELHSMLVYGKGQFFLPHQDSEKHDEMVATLVVSLPSVHTGGELVVDDGGRERVYHAAPDELTLVAFYADRRHEVRRVRSGHRVTLTFNLLLTTPPKAEEREPVSRAAALLAEHFTSAADSRYGADSSDAPIRLAFLLDHEYTQRGLATERFKGADAQRVEVLRAAAAEAGCECVFALAEVHETRDAVVDSGGRYDWYDDEFDDEPDYDDDGTAGDLIDDEVSLIWWITPGASRGEKVQLGLYDGEVCTATPSAALTPYESQYEGYMGNYGNTIDRWYHRAAVVLWPTDKAFTNRGEASPSWAIRAIQRKVTAGDLEGARADTLSLERFWRSTDAATLDKTLRLATGLRDPAAAMVLLAPYELDLLTVKDAKPLAAAVAEYGATWSTRLLDHWDPDRRFGNHDRVDWCATSLAPLCRGLREHGADAIAEQLTGRIWRWLWHRAEPALGWEHPARRTAEVTQLGAPLARLLDSAPDSLAKTIVETVRAADDRIVQLLITTLRAHESPATPAVSAMAQDCWERIVRRLAQPRRAPDDWSISWSGCGCADCDHLARFLGSSTQRSDIWPLAQQRRQHIHQRIQDAGLPVTHVTRREGSPYKLVLTKTDELFTQESTERQETEAQLSWLVATFR